MVAAAWTQWEGQVVNGVYPLRRFLNATDHSSVFLTESTTEGFLNAAIKLIAADPARVDVQLWQWKTASTFSHPHLMRLLDSGQCEIDGRRLLFVVMEYAEETLSQVLPYRALAVDEVRELLVPTLEALAFLHRENWVQGQLKPSNFLVVNDQLKLAMDTLRPAGVAGEPLTQPSLYDPPEARQGVTSLATDVWALGVTLVEALTQHPPSWPQGPTQAPSLPANLPPAFLDTVQRCLSVDPENRPSVADLQQSTQPAPAAQPSPAPPPQPARQTPAPESAMRAIPPHSYSSSSRHSSRGDSERRGWAMPAVAAVLVVLVAVWGGSKLFRGHPKVTDVAQQGPSQQEAARPPNRTPTPRAAAASTERPIATPAPPLPAAAPAVHAPRAAGSGSAHAPRVADSGAAAILHEEIPKVSQSARQTIRGHVRVSVRVTVNKSGNVVRDTFENASSSKYFNRVASEAARKWRFAAGDTDSSREWLLHFEFGREGTTVHATRSRS
jgi:TonB family protein